MDDGQLIEALQQNTQAMLNRLGIEATVRIETKAVGLKQLTVETLTRTLATMKAVEWRPDTPVWVETLGTTVLPIPAVTFETSPLGLTIVGSGSPAVSREA